MDRSLIFGAAVILFCVRDARLLATQRGLFVAFVPILLAVAAGCGLLAERLSESEARELLADIRFWLPAASIHALLSFRSGRRSLLARPPDWLSIMPAPVLCVAMIGAGRQSLTAFDGVAGLQVGLVIGGAYGCAVALLVVSRLCGKDALASLRFASIAHVSALLLVPALAAPDRPLTAQSVDWLVTGLVLGSVLVIFGASLVWHRIRHR